ncbi:MAG: nucleotide pyrophosphohydrolase [Candidatus Cloacimonadota bacterium]|nr:MAG: nucleotide pyrophosphohydrolase [Candidatus Cloacimonadota bacterium]
MDLKVAQSLVDEYILQFKEGYFPPLCNFARLVEEVGELSREMNHNYGPKKKKSSEDQTDKTKEEVGDILFTLIVLANQMDIDLSDSLQQVLNKYNLRDKSRWTLV